MFGLFAWLQQLWLLVGMVASPGFPPKMTAQQEADALQRLAQGDPQARNQLVEGNLRFVVHIARKFLNTGMELDDLISIGTIGLIKAVNTYSPQKGIKLATYAARCIENEILMYLRSSRSKNKDAYLQEPIGSDAEGNDLTLADILGTSPTVVSDAVERRLQDRKLLETMQAVLTDQEARVLKLRYGLGMQPKQPQRVIGQMLGVSRSYVSRIERRALTKLQAAMQKPE